MKRDKKTETRVGIFVVLSLLIGGLVVFAIGNRKNMWKSKSEYHAYFDSVGGVRKGNVVHVAGVMVGSISSVKFVEDGRVKVTFEITDDTKRLIRGPAAGDAKGSVASIESKGMLGDKLMAISVGDPSLPEWSPKKPIYTRSGGGGLMEQAEAMMGDAKGTVTNLREVTDRLNEEKFAEDIKATAANLAKLSDMMANGDGAVQRFMTDPNTADEVEATLRNLRATSAEFAQTARALRSVANEVRNGDGSAHRLIYGGEAADAVANIGNATGEFATVLKDVRQGDGTLHSLIYEDKASNMISNLNAATADIKAITHDVRRGKGTIGGLMSDPSIYEDVKRLVGDLQRNDILRALVRYSIKRDRAEPPAEVTPAEAE